jgi:hypothetical protein
LRGEVEIRGVRKVWLGVTLLTAGEDYRSAMTSFEPFAFQGGVVKARGLSQGEQEDFLSATMFPDLRI